MPVGATIGSDQVSNIITALAVRLRDVMQQIANLNLAVNGQGAGLAYLESLGYSPEDAALALSIISYLNTVSSVYFGTATQGTAYNFNQQLSEVWAGQVGT